MAAETYRAAGVDVDATDAWLKSLRTSLPSIGGFGGVFPLGPHLEGLREPCLVVSCDGVGTKILVARAAEDLSGIGIDCVAMVVNDLICSGAKPVLFLDYLAVGKFDEAQAGQILAGLRRGCEEADCPLIGGETAELPGLLRPGHFDVCGFGVGIVDQSRLIDGDKISDGDAVIGIPSSGLHANGFSLARRALPEFESDRELARVMLTPTRIYVRQVERLLEAVPVKGIAHVTGGGVPGNLCRVLPHDADARIDPGRWERPEIFGRLGNRVGDRAEMFRTFNMGIGLCVVVAPDHVDPALIALASGDARVIGEITPGEGQVHIRGVDL